MKRSRINEVIKDMENLIKKHGFEIPPFAKWTPEDVAPYRLLCNEYPEAK